MAPDNRDNPDNKQSAIDYRYGEDGEVFNHGSLKEREKKAGEGINTSGNNDTPSDKDIDIAGQEKQKGGWDTDVSPPREDNTRNAPFNFVGKLKRKGPIGAIVATMLVGGIGVSIIATLLLPLKMFGIAANITDAASAIPSYAVERRTEYMVTRAFSTWLIRKGTGGTTTDADIESAAVFCRNASISCSLTWTRINRYFEDQYNLAWDNSDGTRKVVITPKGRDTLGANARSWTVEVVETGLDGEAITRQIEDVNKNAEMKRQIRDHVANRMQTKGVITRYVARKALMKRYGVTNFRGFEKTSNAIAEKKVAFKAAMMRNTIGKISPKASTYLACLSGGTPCDSLKELYKSEIDGSEQRKNPDGTYAETSEEYERRLKRNAELSKAAGTVIDPPAADGKMSKHISKQLVSKLSGPVAIAGIVDTIMKAIDTLDSGALETITYSMRSTANVGFAFGDEAGIMPNIEKFKAGDGDDTDMMSIVAEQFENVEQSPVFQAETGLMNSSTNGGNFKRVCDKGDAVEEVTLVDSYVCPERQMVYNMTDFMENDYLQPLKIAADAWNSTAGVAFGWVDGVVGWLADKAGVNALLDKFLGDKFSRFAEWIIGLFFDVPSLGDEATGDQNYDALSGGVWVAQNGMMENGIENGDLLGGGGKLLTNEQIAMIQGEYRQQELEQFSSQTYLARMFNTDLKDSFASRLIAHMPMATFSGSTGVLSLPSTAMASLPGILSPSSSADVGIKNPHNIPLYGYEPGNPALTADPTDLIFSQEAEGGCKKSAKEREDGYDLRKDLYPIKTYDKADPCALERMVIGNILQDMGVKDDTHSFKEPVSSGPSDEGGGARITREQLNELIRSYGLPVSTSEGENGYDTLLKKLTDNPDASWAAGAMLAGEKKALDKGVGLKEYLSTGWLWFENGSAGWPDPYAINCNDNRPGFTSEVSVLCGSSNFQIAGYQAATRRGDYRAMFEKLYAPGELSSVMQKVVQNSDKASRETWKYNGSGQQKGLVSQHVGSVSGATLNDISPSQDFIGPKTQFMTLVLGKDPAMVAALNSFAVSDGDLINALKSAGCGYNYICAREKQLLSNMITALYMFDSKNGDGGLLNSVGSGLAAIFGGVGNPTMYPFGPDSDNGLYGYGTDYGLNGRQHTGTDIVLAPNAPLYSPVSGTIRCSGTNKGTGTKGGGCSAFNDFYGRGNGRIEIEMDNGNVLILGHTSTSTVTVGQRVTPRQQVGTNGGMNSWHVHVECRIPEPSLPAGWRIVDPSMCAGGGA